jgi:hypothetical protein
MFQIAEICVVPCYYYRYYYLEGRPFQLIQHWQQALLSQPTLSSPIDSRYPNYLLFLCRDPC